MLLDLLHKKSLLFLYKLNKTILDEGRSHLLKYGQPLRKAAEPAPRLRADGRTIFTMIVCKEVFAMLREIEIKDKAQVEKINRLACEAPYEVWLFTKDMMLDARSLLGLFALVGKKASVVVEDDVAPHALDRLVAKMA